MPKNCCALNCRTGYRGEVKDDNISLHKFPLKNPVLLNQWLRRLSRKDFTPTDNHRLCSKHFHSDDIVRNTVDSNCRRKRTHDVLKCVYLREGAVPSIFDSTASVSLPSYLSEAPSSQIRKSTVLSEHRLKAENDQIQAMNDSLLSQDLVHSLSNIEEHLKSDCACPKGFEHFMVEETLVIASFRLSSGVLNVNVSIAIESSLEFILSIAGTKVNKKAFSHIVQLNHFERFSQVYFYPFYTIKF